MNLPDGRTETYLVWRVCERFNMLPPGVVRDFNLNESWAKAQLYAYQQIRNIEEAEIGLSKNISKNL